MKQLIALAAAALGCVALSAQAQNWPERPIRFLTAGAAGSGIDVFTRTLAQLVSQETGQPVVVENKPGANQILVADLCSKAAPDGYTFCTTSIEPYASNPALFKKLPYDPEKGFAPVAILVTLRAAVVARADMGAKSLAAVAQLSKQTPGKLNWGSTGIGSNSHLYLEAIRSEFGWDVTHIPYKSTPESVQALMAGDVQLIYQQVGPVQNHLDNGTLVALAQAADKRSPHLPNVPTFAEVGIGKYRIPSWWGMVAPAGTPPAVVKRMNELALSIVHRPELQTGLNALSVDPAVRNTPADMAANMKSAREIANVSFRRANVQPN